MAEAHPTSPNPIFLKSINCIEHWLRGICIVLYQKIVRKEAGPLLIFISPSSFVLFYWRERETTIKRNSIQNQFKVKHIS